MGRLERIRKKPTTARPAFSERKSCPSESARRPSGSQPISLRGSESPLVTIFEKPTTTDTTKVLRDVRHNDNARAAAHTARNSIRRRNAHPMTSRVVTSKDETNDNTTCTPEHAARGPGGWIGTCGGSSSELTAREMDASRGRSEGASDDTAAPSKSTRRTKLPVEVEVTRDQEQESEKRAGTPNLSRDKLGLVG